MWITISTSSHPFLHTHSSSWCSSRPIRAYHRTAISTAVLFWATSSHGFQYNNCLQLITSSVSTIASKHRTACMEEEAHLRTESVLAKLLTRMMWIGAWVVEALLETRDTCIREDLWRSSNDAMVISSATYCFLWFKVFPKCGCSLGHSPATVCIMCSERTNPHGWRPKDPILLLQNQTFSCTPLLHSNVIMHISTPLEVTHATAVEIYIASKFITGLKSLLHKPWSDNKILQNGTEWMINLKDIHYAPSHFPYFK